MHDVTKNKCFHLLAISIYISTIARQVIRIVIRLVFQSDYNFFFWSLKLKWEHDYGDNIGYDEADGFIWSYDFFPLDATESYTQGLEINNPSVLKAGFAQKYVILMRVLHVRINIQGIGVSLHLGCLTTDWFTCNSLRWPLQSHLGRLVAWESHFKQDVLRTGAHTETPPHPPPPFSSLSAADGSWVPLTHA